MRPRNFASLSFPFGVLALTALAAGLLSFFVLGPTRAPSPAPAPKTVSATPARLVIEPNWPVLIVGVDGMDWQLADPLLAAGRMPSLAKLIASGARAELVSEEPMLSPLLWTTMATGRLPEDHGVLDFLAMRSDTGAPVPITSDFRRVPALWDMAGEQGLKSVFVGWWATWPAPPVLGALVSDRFAYTALDIDAPPPPGYAWPLSIERELAPLAARASSVDSSQLILFVPGEERRKDDEHVVHLRKALAGAQSYHAAALHLLRREKPRLAGVYYELVDQVCHRFMHLAPPRRPDVSAADFAAFSGAVDAAYAEQDRLLGELLEAAPEKTVVILVSDHGFLNGDARPAGTADVHGRPGRWHRARGVFVASGGLVAAGTRLADVSVRDITPSVLHLLGLPAGADMAGHVVIAAGREERRIPSWSERVKPARGEQAASSPELDAAAVEQLAALGYVGADAVPARGAQPAPSGALTPSLVPTASWHLNRATCLELRGRNDEAASEAREALRLHAFPEAHAILARTAQHGGDPVTALAEARAACAVPGAEAPVHLLLADLLLGARDLDGAEATLRALLGREPRLTSAHARLASVLMLREDIGAAAQEAALVTDDHAASAEALVLAASVLGRAGRSNAALAAVLRARALGADDAGSWVVETLARLELGEETSARGALASGLARHPDDATLQELSAALKP